MLIPGHTCVLFVHRHAARAHMCWMACFELVSANMAGVSILAQGYNPDGMCFRTLRPKAGGHKKRCAR